LLVSSCGLKLDGMSFDARERTRNAALEARVQVKLTSFPVANMLVVCPFPRCSAVVWRYNLMAHICGAHVHLFGEKSTVAQAHRTTSGELYWFTL